MNFRTLVCGHRAVYFGAAFLVFAITLPLAVAQEQGRQAMNPSIMTTGSVAYIVKENSTGTFAHVYFPPGSRTKWHSHSLGQIVFCEEGACINALKGGPVILLHAGEASYAPPGVPHWQGAAPNEGGTQLNINRGDPPVPTFMGMGGDVTDAEYHSATSHLEIVGPKPKK
jgi:quercetin dioxygenase-like cupin family protein